MVTLERFTNEVQMSLEFVLGRECIEIDSLHHIVMLITPPVGTGSGLDLESSAQKFLRIIYVRSTAEIHIIFTRVVDGDSLILRKILDQFRLILLILEDLQSFFLGNNLAGPVFLTLQDLAHLVLDGLEIFLGQRSGESEVIVASIFDLRTDCYLNLVISENLANRLSHYMSQGVTIYL